MFACLYSLSTPVAALVKLAEDFTPRFEVVGPLVMLDVSGLAGLFGSPREIGEHLRRSASGPVRIAIASTQTAAALLALGRPGLTVIADGEQRDALAALPVSLLGDFDRLRLTGAAIAAGAPSPASGDVPRPVQPPNIAAMEDVLPYFQSSLGRTSDAAAAPHRAAPTGGGWMHPRDSHAAVQTRRQRRAVTAPRDTEHAHAASSRRSPVGSGQSSGASRQASGVSRQSPVASRQSSVASRQSESNHQSSGLRTEHSALCTEHSVLRTPHSHSHAALRTEHSHFAPSTPHSHTALRTPHSHAALRTQHSALDTLQTTLRRWGVTTLGALAALPPGDVYERLGARGVLWQRLTRGEDANPLVPWVPEDPFEGSLDLEWPIEGLEPLSFVLGRLLEPLSQRLERADRGAAILHTHLRLVDKTVHARTLQLPAPMRDPKTLRTLVLLDLESHPPSAAIDRVRLLAEPTPARVVQWALFERAQPSPEQVSTLIARLSALMGERHVGAPQLIDSWKPGAFVMQAFEVPAAGAPPSAPRTEHPHAALRTEHSHPPLHTEHSHAALNTAHPPSLAEDPTRALARPRRSGLPAAEAGSALRRFRLPIPARVQVHEGRPVKIMTDRRGVSGGAVVQAAGPWRTSGEWWNDAPQTSHAIDQSSAPDHSHQPYQTHWDRDEWDVAIADGTVYRIYVEREIGQWFLEGIID